MQSFALAVTNSMFVKFYQIHFWEAFHVQRIILHLGSEVTPTEVGSKAPNTLKQRLGVLS